MNKPVLGLVAGGALGIVDGLTALVSAPEVAPAIVGIIVGSMGKGLVAGMLIGWFARKVNNLAAGVVFGLAMGALFALPFAIATDPNTGQKYFWEIMIPGSMVGLIVGFLTQRYGTRTTAVAR
jgi:mannose/fructose/N-acetylgalactosamine-specific phosphotransferase system component IIC